MKPYVLLALMASPVYADPVWITVEKSTLQAVPGLTATEIALPKTLKSNGTIGLYQLDERQLDPLSHFIHENKRRCGGYFAFSSQQEALAYLQTSQQAALAASFVAPPIAQQSLVNSLLPQLNSAGITQVITDLSGFTNRYYTTTSGKAGADWIFDRWTALASSKSWIKVSRISHTGYNQPSILLEMLGSERPSEVVVLGGHLDSINGAGTSETTRAPGADDDASGIATMTEIIRVLASNNVQPKRTLRFYGYAAEEVGLRGSKDIATRAQSAATNVIGVMQLDMTNYKGGAEDIVLMTDYTNSALNSFVQSLVSTYQPNLVQSTDVCGYGCSDHASWHNAGYAATMPFEAKFAKDNKNIHTVSDTLANSDPSGAHALKFAKLGLSYAIELGMAGSTTPPPASGSFSNLTAAKGSWVYKTITVPSGMTTLSVTMSGGSGDADLYVKAGSNPTLSSYNCRPYKTGNTESCAISKPAAGTWVIGLYSYAAFSGVNVSWSAR